MLPDVITSAEDNDDEEPYDYDYLVYLLSLSPDRDLTPDHDPEDGSGELGVPF